jgi:hypothetical protein
MLVSVENDIHEMNVIVRFKRGKRVYSCSIRRGGHIQSIVGTECSTSALAEVLLEELAKDLRSGRWEIGTMNGRPYAKRTDSSLRAMMAATNWGSEE